MASRHIGKGEGSPEGRRTLVGDGGTHSIKVNQALVWACILLLLVLVEGHSGGADGARPSP